MSSPLTPVALEYRQSWVERMRDDLQWEILFSTETGMEDWPRLGSFVDEATALLEAAFVRYVAGQCGREEVREAFRYVVHSWWYARAEYRVTVLGKPRGRSVERYMAERRAELEGTEPTA